MKKKTKKRKKRTGGMKKGSVYEREICKQLSLWWTNNKRDDVFWRTAGSGARATQRSKRNKQTYGQYGDVQAIDPMGEPLTKLLTIEIKRGYSKNTFADLIETSQNPKVKSCMYQQFIEQAEKSSEEAHTYSWLIIAKRNGREPIVIIPHYLYMQDEIPNLYHNNTIKIRFDNGEEMTSIFIIALKSFLAINPKQIKKLYKQRSLNGLPTHG